MDNYKDYMVWHKIEGYGWFVFGNKSAKELGVKFYSNGNVCNKGHNSPRYTSSNHCVECAHSAWANRKKS